MNSCQKIDTIQANFKNVTINQTKFLIKSNSISANNILADSINTKMLWDSINLISLNKYEDIVSVPLKYFDINTNLIYFKKKSDDIGTYPLLININDLSNFKHNSIDLIKSFYNNNVPLSFTGKIIAHSVENKFLWEVKFTNGKKDYEKRIQTDLGSLTTNTDKIKANANLSSNRIKSTSCVAYYLVTYYSDGSIEWDFISTVCDSPCEITSVITKDSTEKIRSLCGATSTGGGGSSIPASSFYKIKSNFTDKCIEKLWNSMMSKSFDNKVTEILHDIFELSSKYVLTIDDVPMMFDENNFIILGKGDAPYYDLNNVLHIDVHISRGTLASREAMTATLYHEIIHSYLKAEFYKKYNDNFSSHTEMLKNYVGNIQQALMSDYSNLSPEYAKALSLGGIFTKGVKTSLSIDELEKVNSINGLFESGRLGEPLCQATSSNPIN